MHRPGTPAGGARRRCWSGQERPPGVRICPARGGRRPARPEDVRAPKCPTSPPRRPPTCLSPPRSLPRDGSSWDPGPPTWTTRCSPPWPARPSGTSTRASSRSWTSSGSMLRAVFRTANQLTMPMSGTGSAGMETCMVNLLEPGDRVLVGVNGVFGTRMAEVARRCGAEVTEVKGEWGRAFEADALRAGAAARPLRPRRRRPRGDVHRRAPAASPPCVSSPTTSARSSSSTA